MLSPPPLARMTSASLVPIKTSERDVPTCVATLPRQEGSLVAIDERCACAVVSTCATDAALHATVAMMKRLTETRMVAASTATVRSLGGLPPPVRADFII